MINRGTHIIHKVLTDVQVHDRETAFKLKDDMSTFLRERVFPIIEGHMNAISSNYEDAIIRMDQLSLDLNFSNIKKIDIQQIHKSVETAFERSLTKKLQENELFSAIENPKIIPPVKSKLEAFFFFLEKGKAPWWQPQLSTIFKEENFKGIVEQEGFKKRLKTLLKKPKIQQRLIYQLDDRQLVTVFKESPISKKKLLKLEAILGKVPNLRTRFWKELIHLDLSKAYQFKDVTLKELKREDRTQLLEIISEVIGESVGIKAKKIKENNNTEQKENDSTLKLQKSKERDTILFEKGRSAEKKIAIEEGEYVANAGLILLHPFLLSFFRNLKFLGEDSKLLEEKKTIAVHLLHYLSTKTVQAYESELLLEKFLCGIAIEEPIERNIEIPKEFLTEAEALLEACLKNWTALKSNSPDALRTTFLQRDGKLIFEEERYRLIIERKTQDILLDRIPWNVNIIKLPWLDNILFVEW